MTDKMTEDEREAERRFQETLGRLVNTPHKPHKPKGVSDGPRPVPGSAAGRRSDR